MKIKLSNRDIIGLYNTLEGLNYRGVKFAYTIARNINSLKPIVESIDKSLAIPKEFAEYDKARLELAKKYADKDEAGKPLVKENQFIITDKVAFEAEIDALQEKHKEVIEARAKQLDEYKVLQDEELEVEVFTIPHVLLPNDISTKELTAIFSIIEEEKAILSPLSDEMTKNKEE